jgi:hypothetical protein
METYILDYFHMWNFMLSISHAEAFLSLQIVSTPFIVVIRFLGSYVGTIYF